MITGQPLGMLRGLHRQRVRAELLRQAIMRVIIAAHLMGLVGHGWGWYRLLAGANIEHYVLPALLFAPSLLRSRQDALVDL